MFYKKYFKNNAPLVGPANKIKLSLSSFRKRGLLNVLINELYRV